MAGGFEAGESIFDKMTGAIGEDIVSGLEQAIAASWDDRLMAGGEQSVPPSIGVVTAVP